MYIVVLLEVVDCIKIDVCCLCSVWGIYCIKWMDWVIDVRYVGCCVYCVYRLYII